MRAAVGGLLSSDGHQTGGLRQPASIGRSESDALSPGAGAPGACGFVHQSGPAGGLSPDLHEAALAFVTGEQRCFAFGGTDKVCFPVTKAGSPGNNPRPLADINTSGEQAPSLAIPGLPLLPFVGTA